MFTVGARAQCENPFAGCTDVAFNTTPFNGILYIKKEIHVPSPAAIIVDNSLALLEAAVSDLPWLCNMSVWGGVVLSRCLAPDVPICTIEELVLTPSPASTDRRRMGALSPSPQGCRTSVALSEIVEGWCKEGAVCDVSCTSDPSTRRIFDMYVDVNADCPTGMLVTISPETAAMMWLLAAATMAPALCLSSWQIIVLVLRSKLHCKGFVFVFVLFHFNFVCNILHFVTLLV